MAKMADTKEFDVVRIARSDGADSGPGYWPPASAPAPAPAKKAGKETASTPRVKAQMIRLEQDDPRFIEWRIKLGILLKQELAPNPEEGNSWYVYFPRGYWLYEKSKHLWVSGYPIKGKLFKSPQEFGLHLIWLLSSSMDYTDCCCVHCNFPGATKVNIASDLAAANNSAAAPFKYGATPHRLPAASSSATTLTQQSLPRPAPSGSKTQTLQTPSTAAAAQTQTRPQPQARSFNAATALAQQAKAHPAQTSSQLPSAFHWTLKAPFLFRAGELVWYQNGTSWRLGIISMTGNDSFQLVPIGHEEALQPNVTKSMNEMRPFHAFSVPNVMLPELNGKLFDEVDWRSLFQTTGDDRIKRTNLILDASKMAASKIDASYSLWCPLTQDGKAETIPYYGCFFGAERIEVGDCVRVAPLSGDATSCNDSSVLGLRGIIAHSGASGNVLFRGNVYQIAKMGPGTADNAVPLHHLPLPLRDESQWRSHVMPDQPWRWVLVKEDVFLEEHSIRGRFYPAHRLMPILNGPGFSTAVAEGKVENQYPFLNNRMDGSGGYIGRQANRRDTLGTSVPPDAVITLEPLIREHNVDEFNAVGSG